MIEELRTLAEKATPGPWNASPYRGHIGSQVWAGEPGPNAKLILCDGGADNDADAALIVALVNNLPAILTAASKLEVAKKALRKSQQGWENVVEMGILPPRHWETANNLSNDCLQALAALEAK